MRSGTTVYDVKYETMLCNLSIYTLVMIIKVTRCKDDIANEDRRVERLTNITELSMRRSG